MLIGCDGIFNRINDEEIFTWIWEILNEDIGKTVNSIHSLSSTAVDLVIKTALKRGSKDNVTALFIAFNNYQKKFDDVVKQLKRSDGLLVLKSQET
jgi:serine/threonine protein phosphatase PrpC